MDFRGEIKLILDNIGKLSEEIKEGDRIAQAILMKYEVAEFVVVNSKEELSKTDRNTGGFGSTGI